MESNFKIKIYNTKEKYMFTSKGYNIFVAIFFILTGVTNLVGSVIELSVYQLAIGVIFTAVGVFWYRNKTK